MKPIYSAFGNPILVVPKTATEAFRYMKQLVDYDFLLFRRREVVKVFRDDLDCVVSLHS
jgi:hypothetical protein